jgi:hypothetical protein
MSKKNFLEACREQTNYTVATSRGELELFCEIMEWSKEDVYFVADDPHGVVSLGDYFFNMSDIHEVVANYPKLLERFGSNEELSNTIIHWYDWTLEYHSKHTPMEWVKIKSIDKFTGKPHYTFPEDGQEVFIKWGAKGMTNIAKFRKAIYTAAGVVKNVFCEKSRTDLSKYDKIVHFVRRPDYWCPVTVPTDEHYINLHSWLMGAYELVEKGE